MMKKRVAQGGFIVDHDLGDDIFDCVINGLPWNNSLMQQEPRNGILN